MNITRFPAASLILALRVVCALALAAPITCQNEAEAYFSLSSTKTFGSHEKPVVQLTGFGLAAVQIRVYRVNDPLKFFTQLEDPHSFGGRNPRPQGKRTFLEAVHDWKTSLRRTIRLSLRGQFTESPRAHIEKAFPEKAAAPVAPTAATYYADAPLLNQEQLVMAFNQPVRSVTRWDSASVPIPVKDKGVFLVEAVHGELRAYTILMVSDTVLITKTARNHILASLVDRRSGEPVVNGVITTIMRNAAPATTQTGKDGLAEIPVEFKVPAGVRLLAANGADFCFSEISEWSFNGANRNWSGYIYTDRPVYRPGDTMHFRGILRLQAAVGYEVPTSQQFTVQINDADGKAVYQKTLSSSAGGIIHDEFALPKASALGNYYIQVHAGDREMGGNFEVQEYKKPEYEVRVTPDKTRVLEGEAVRAVIDGRYYFGEPVNGGKVKYSIYRSRYWFPFWYDAEDDSEEGGGYDDSRGEQIADESGQLDADGKLTVSLPTTVSDNRIDYRYRIEAGVTDKAGREISGTGWLVATYGSFVVNVRPNSYVYEPGGNAGFTVEARDYDNHAVATPVHLALFRYDWHQRSDSGVVAATDVTTGVDGKGAAALRIAEAGSYEVVATAKTPEGKEVRDSSYVWVSGAGAAWDWGGQEKSIQIVPDKKTYQPGDRAKFLLVTGEDNTPLLVTVEGRDIRSRTLLRSKGATAEFEYTVSGDDEPGFYVNAQFVRKGEMYQGQKRVKVPPVDHKLRVTLSTDKPQYLPGQTATYNVEVTSADGKPVGQTDLSLGVVDEAIYAIRPDQTPDILDFFYGREYDAVSTESSLNYFFNGEAGKRRMRLADLRRPSQLAQLKPDRLVKPKIRKAFPDTAFWAADITTDNEGHAQTKVAFPDSLTTWRATARGVAPNAKFGAATLKTIVRKNLILRLAVPRFFVQGDEVVISGLVHNYLTSAKKARVSVKLEGLELSAGTVTQDIEIASRGEAKVDWRVKAQSVRRAKITGEALTDEESDALELELPVNPPGVPVHEAKSGSIRNTGTSDFALSFPTNVVPGSRTLSLRLSPSVAGTIFSALEYLTAFPYGCVEQTMSSFLPDIMVAKSMRELNLKQPMDESALHDKIQAGLDRLYNFEHEDGGWGWWETDQTHPFMTAYVVAGLAEARADGIEVKTEAIDKGAAWIQAELARNQNLEPDLRAYLGYALSLAGKTNMAALNRSYGDRAELSAYGAALLGLAFESVKDQRAGELAGRLESTVFQDADEASWPSKRDEMLDFAADVTPETTAYAMKLLSHQRPNSPVLPKAALWLVNHRSGGYWWVSTKQTAMVIYGLIDYVKATNELHPSLSVSVTVNGEPAATQSFSALTAVDAPEVLLDEAKLQTGTNQIHITSSGQGRLYYSAIVTYYSNEARFEKRAALSLNILRDYFRLAPSKESERIVYNLSALDGSVGQGDVIAVRLTVSGSEWKYLLVEDPIPAGTEFIEKDNLYELKDKPPWWQYWFTRRELHDDHMAIFQTYFREGQQQYFYLLKVVNPGLFHASPAHVQPMYQPAHEATTEGRTLEVR